MESRFVDHRRHYASWQGNRSSAANEPGGVGEFEENAQGVQDASPNHHRENYLNTLHFTSKLLATNPLDKKVREKLRQEIEQAKALGERQ